MSECGKARISMKGEKATAGHFPKHTTVEVFTPKGLPPIDRSSIHAHQL